MKKLLVICGAGLATSTVAKAKVDDWIRDNGYSNQIQVTQSTISEQVNSLNDYDAVISMTTLGDGVQGNIVSGFPLLTGIGAEAVFEEVKQYLEL